MPWQALYGEVAAAGCVFGGFLGIHGFGTGLVDGGAYRRDGGNRYADRETEMFNADFARTAFAMMGALVFTVTAVGAAVGPARVAETTPVVYAGVASGVVEAA